MASLELYKLRCSIFGHEQDVRCVTPAFCPEGAIVSGSRDVKTKVWVPNEDDVGFREGLVMSGHSNFVSCVCVMPPSDSYPQGLIVTGSNDKTILVYTLDSPSALYKLEGHTSNVCALAAGKFGTLISGSWDKTARVWLNQKCMMTLSGHTQAVWAVAIMPEGGYMLTGAADKLIKLWKAGKCERTFTGHDDCVRGLVVMSAAEFLSCANDATVRRWLVSGDCTQVYYGHSNYVYSLALLPNGEDFVSTSEDRTMRVWRKGECTQTIAHPTESVWTVCVLPNGDVVTGSSDGVIRVFTCDPSRMASDQEQQAYEEQLAASTIPAQIGDVDVKNLVGPEALLNPGKSDGQTLMIRTPANQVEAHQWSAAEGRWIKIGDVLSGSGGSQAKSGKQLYEGKEYDFVFDVELDEGAPGLKLPYNIGEDPWMVAHHWLQKNELSPLLLDQVANFIQEQTKGVTLGQAAPPSSVSDPFTGAGRYVPGAAAPGAGAPAPASDPFTGGGRYIPGTGGPGPGTGRSHGADPFTGSTSYNPAGDGETKDMPTNSFFPQKSVLTFDTANIPAIMGKVSEFSVKVSLQLSDADKMLVEELLSDKAGCSAQHFVILDKMLQWPSEVLFPVLDVLRLVIKTPAGSEHYLQSQSASSTIQFLTRHILDKNHTSNQLVALRTICSCFKTTLGETALMEHRDTVITSALECKEVKNKNVQISLSTVMLNYSVLYQRLSDMEAKTQLLSAGALILEAAFEVEAQFRMLVCVGTIMWGNTNCVDLAKSLGLFTFVNQLQAVTEPAKVGECAKFVAMLA